MPKNIRDILNPLVKFSTWKNSISVRENHLLSQRFFDNGSLITSMIYFWVGIQHVRVATSQHF